MNLLLTESVDWTRIIIEYVAYAAVIVVGILILLLLRRKTRLPRHRELRTQLHDLSAAADAFRTQPPTGLKRFKALSALIYRLDKLIYVTDRMADKERDGQIAGISTLLTAVNLGGLGTLIASLASLISFKFFAKEYPDQKGSFMKVFTVWNVLFLLVLTAEAFLIGRLAG